MENQDRFVMISPAPGFTTRVMTRLAERERVRARRRALIGSALLVGAAIAVILFVAFELASVGWLLITNPQVIITLPSAVGVIAFWVNKVIEAFWIAANAIANNLDPTPVALGAVMIFALTMLWVRVVTGSFQLSLSTNHVGGLRK